MVIISLFITLVKLIVIILAISMTYGNNYREQRMCLGTFFKLAMQAFAETRS